MRAEVSAVQFPGLSSAVLSAVAQSIATEVWNRVQDALSKPMIRPRLFTVEQAAVYIGRTKDAIQHMIANGKLPVVRSDRRVFLDVKDQAGELARRSNAERSFVFWSSEETPSSHMPLVTPR
jgi:excisionase family DNA binding protein